MRTSNTPIVVVDQRPLLMTVPEAAAILRASRATGYALAWRLPAAGGAEGLPVRRIGHQLRVEREGLLDFIGPPGGSRPRLRVVRHGDGAA